MRSNGIDISIRSLLLVVVAADELCECVCVCVRSCVLLVAAAAVTRFFSDWRLEFSNSI